MDKRYAFALGETEMDGLVTLDHKEKMMNNAIDGGIVYLGNAEDTNVGNIKPQVGSFVLHVGHGAIVTLSGNAGHFDNQIARTGLANLEDIEIGCIKTHVRRIILPQGSDVTVLVAL